MNAQQASASKRSNEIKTNYARGASQAWQGGQAMHAGQAGHGLHGVNAQQAVQAQASNADSEYKAKQAVHAWNAWQAYASKACIANMKPTNFPTWCWRKHISLSLTTNATTILKPLALNKTNITPQKNTTHR